MSLKSCCPSPLLGICLLLGLLSGATSGASSEDPRLKRLALVIGNNVGLRGEAPLRHSLKDAEAVAQILRSAGSFDKDRVYFLSNPKPADVLGALREMSGRVKELKKAGSPVLALVFYSGHGGPEALHLAGTKVPKSDFLSSFRSIEANLNILVLDACRSGGFLRPKGGELVAAPVIERVDELRLNGTAILSSSARDELSVESDELGGSVFTHHFVSGLRGAADFNHDGTVTLWEAFTYTQAGTEWESLERRGRGQTPGFDFDMVGSADFGLSRVDRAGATLVFKNLPSGRLDIYPIQGSQGRARIWLRGGDTVHFALPANRYMLALERNGKIAVHQADLSWKKKYALSASDFKTYKAEQVRMKGGFLLVEPHALHFSGTARSFPYGSRTPFFGMRYFYSLYPFRMGLDLAYGRDAYTGAAYGRPVYRVERDIYALNGIAGLPLHRLGPLFPSLEFGVGVNAVRQRVQDLRFEDMPDKGGSGSGQTRNGLLYSAQVGYHLSLPLSYRFSVQGGAGYAAYLYPRSEDGAWKLSHSLEPRLGIGADF